MHFLKNMIFLKRRITPKRQKLYLYKTRLRFMWCYGCKDIDWNVSEFPEYFQLFLSISIYKIHEKSSKEIFWMEYISESLYVVLYILIASNNIFIKKKKESTIIIFVMRSFCSVPNIAFNKVIYLSQSVYYSHLPYLKKGCQT